MKKQRETKVFTLLVVVFQEAKDGRGAEFAENFRTSQVLVDFYNKIVYI